MPDAPAAQDWPPGTGGRICGKVRTSDDVTGWSGGGDEAGVLPHRMALHLALSTSLAVWIPFLGSAQRQNSLDQLRLHMSSACHATPVHHVHNRYHIASHRIAPHRTAPRPAPRRAAFAQRRAPHRTTPPRPAPPRPAAPFPARHHAMPCHAMLSIA